jgi:hypothetical protein
MNTSISQQEKTFNWNSDDRLLELPFKYFQSAILKVKINKPMTKLSWIDLKTATIALDKNKTNSNAF